MQRFHEPVELEELEVSIEDLGAPGRGLRFVLFSLGEAWRAAIRLRWPALARLAPLGALAFLLLSSSVPLPPAALPASAFQHGRACLAVRVDSADNRPAGAMWVYVAAVHVRPGDQTTLLCHVVPRDHRSAPSH